MKQKSKDEFSLISKSMSFKGNIKGESDLRIDGYLEGDVSIEGNLFLSENASIKGNIFAENFVCNGRVEGNIVVKDKLTLEKNASILGDIRTRVLVITEGAELNGNCVATKNEINKDEFEK